MGGFLLAGVGLISAGLSVLPEKRQMNTWVTNFFIVSVMLIQNFIYVSLLVAGNIIWHQTHVVIIPSRQIWQVACQYCTVFIQQSQAVYYILTNTDLYGYIKMLTKFGGLTFSGCLSYVVQSKRNPDDDECSACLECQLLKQDFSFQEPWWFNILFHWWLLQWEQPLALA